MRLRMWGCWPLLINFNGQGYGTQHRMSNPRLISFDWVRLGIAPLSPSSGRRLWFYMRGNWACCLDFYIDRREYRCPTRGAAR